VTNNDLALEAVRQTFGQEPFLYLVRRDNLDGNGASIRMRWYRRVRDAGTA
jgi:hypothetical protein